MKKSFAISTATWFGGVALACFSLTGQAWAADMAPEAMVQKVAGESVIFEGTEGLPAQIARRLQERQLSLTLSEQFTGGLGSYGAGQQTGGCGARSRYRR